MRLLGRHVLIRAGRKNAPPQKWLATWAANVEAAEWRSLDDVRRDYPSADGVRLAGEIVVTIFNVKGNEYRLLSSIDYDVAAVQVLEIMTHAEYDKELWKRRY